jgi:hypothetical protein
MQREREIEAITLSERLIVSMELRASCNHAKGTRIRDERVHEPSPWLARTGKLIWKLWLRALLGLIFYTLDEYARQI